MAKNNSVLSTINKERLKYLYWKRNLSTHKIAKMYGVTSNAIKYRMIKYNIERRQPKSIQKEKYKISEELLKKLYLKRKLTTIKIAKKLGVKSSSTVSYKLMKFGIPTRTISEIKTKYPIIPFSGDLKEKAYILGLRTGDLTITKSFYKIRVSVSTTHPALLKTMKKGFGKYTRVMTFIHKDKRGIRELHIYCSLDQSFEFLLEKIRKIPSWIINNDDYFFSFLAGYSDAEGSFDVFENTDDTVSFHFRVASNDKEILSQILDKLKSKKFFCKLYLHAKKGKKATYGTYSKNVYALRMFRKNDVLRLVNILKDRSCHEEKTKRMGLILSLKKCKKWSEVREKVFKLRREISNSRIR